MLSLFVCVAAGVVFAVMAGRGAYHTYRLNSDGLRAAATVEDVHALGRDSYVTVRFVTADGREVTARVGDFSWSPPPRPGDAVTVLYDPRTPDGVLRDARMSGDYLLALIALLAAGSLGVGGPLVLRRTWSMWQDNAEAWRSGRHFA